MFLLHLSLFGVLANRAFGSRSTTSSVGGDAPHRIATDAVKELFSDFETALVYGRSALRSGAVQGAPRELAAFVATSSLRDPAVPTGNNYRARHKADLCAGDIILVEGWVLSRTEAHATGLLALLYDGGARN